MQASQASLERLGSAPAPFSACLQAEPRPVAQTHAARVQGSTQDASRGDTGTRARPCGFRGIRTRHCVGGAILGRREEAQVQRRVHLCVGLVCLKTDCWQKASAAGSSCAGSSSAGSSAAGSSAGAPHRGLHSCVLASRHRAPRLAATTALCKLPVVACELPAPGGNIQRKKTPVSLFEATRGPPRERPVSYPRRAPEPNARFWKSTT